MSRAHSKIEIGQGLDKMEINVIQDILRYVLEYRVPGRGDPEEELKMAVDTPTRVKFCVQKWITRYDAKHGAGSATTFMNECLTLAGSSETAATINAALTALETSLLPMVDNVNNQGWTWDQVADWIEANITLGNLENFSYKKLVVPSSYTTVWGDPW